MTYRPGDLPPPRRPATPTGRCRACQAPAYLSAVGWAHVGADDGDACVITYGNRAEYVADPHPRPGVLFALAAVGGAFIAVAGGWFLRMGGATPVAAAATAIVLYPFIVAMILAGVAYARAR